MRIRIYAINIPNRHKRDNLYPVGHLSLLSPDYSWSLRSFNRSEQSANKRLFNMSATHRQWCYISPAWDCDCKGTIKFAHLQILSWKVSKIHIERLFPIQCNKNNHLCLKWLFFLLCRNDKMFCVNLARRKGWLQASSEMGWKYPSFLYSLISLK